MATYSISGVMMPRAGVVQLGDRRAGLGAVDACAARVELRRQVLARAKPLSSGFTARGRSTSSTSPRRQHPGVARARQALPRCR